MTFFYFLLLFFLKFGSLLIINSNRVVFINMRLDLYLCEILDGYTTSKAPRLSKKLLQLLIKEGIFEGALFCKENNSENNETEDKKTGTENNSVLKSDNEVESKIDDKTKNETDNGMESKVTFKSTYSLTNPPPYESLLYCIQLIVGIDRIYFCGGFLRLMPWFANLSCYVSGPCYRRYGLEPLKLGKTIF